MPPPVYLSHPSSLGHDTGEHPERSARMRAIEAELERRSWLGMRRLESVPAERAQLLAVHDESYVAQIEGACARGPARLDADTMVAHDSLLAASHAAGGAAMLVDLLLSGEASSGFSAHRPPGHHAERARAMGFCLFNSVAVAAAHALSAHGLKRVLVLDWDVHHGNGTSDIFHADSRVLYASIHQSPLYPGTGAADDIGTGEGVGFTLNLPVPPRSSDERFESLVEHVVVPVARAYEPQLVLVSAGYDAHYEDPLAQCAVTEDGFASMTASMVRLCEQLRVPLGCVLEGGYDLGALGRSLVATLAVLADPAGARRAEPVLHPASVAARERLAQRWDLGD